MGFVSSVVGGLFGGGKTSKSANGALQAATDEAKKVTKEAVDTARADLAPYRTAGTDALSGLAQLVSDPAKQADFIRNNEFYKVMGEDTTNKLFSNMAARGKVGSGGTAEALQNSLMLLGQNLLNSTVSNRMNLANMGLGAAGQSGAFSTGGANSLVNLITNQGNANAADKTNQSNSFMSGLGTVANIGSALWSLSDRRMKKDIRKVGKLRNGLSVYTYKYKGDDKTIMGVMAQEVEKKKPSAVRTVGGVKYVNLGAVA